jgi:hypothetical protein
MTRLRVSGNSVRAFSVISRSRHPKARRARVNRAHAPSSRQGELASRRLPFTGHDHSPLRWASAQHQHTMVLIERPRALSNVALNGHEHGHSGPEVQSTDSPAQRELVIFPLYARNQLRTDGPSLNWRINRPPIRQQANGPGTPVRFPSAMRRSGSRQ